MRHRAKVLVVTASTTALLLAGAAPGQATTLATGQGSTLGTSITAVPAAGSYGRTMSAGLLLGHAVAEQFSELVAAGVAAADPPVVAEFSELVTAAVDDVLGGSLQRIRVIRR